MRRKPKSGKRGGRGQKGTVKDRGMKQKKGKSDKQEALRHSTRRIG